MEWVCVLSRAPVVARQAISEELATTDRATCRCISGCELRALVTSSSSSSLTRCLRSVERKWLDETTSTNQPRYRAYMHGALLLQSPVIAVGDLRARRAKPIAGVVVAAAGDCWWCGGTGVQYCDDGQVCGSSTEQRSRATRTRLRDLSTRGQSLSLFICEQQSDHNCNRQSRRGGYICTLRSIKLSAH